MSKRFIDTEIFNDSWFTELSPNAKLFFIYLFTQCDHAGIIDLNIKLAEYQTGIKQLTKSYVSLIKELGNRIYNIRENYYYLTKYVNYQYPGFPKSKVRQQDSALKILIKFGLYDNEIGEFIKELSNSYDNVIVSDTVIVIKEKKCLFKNSEYFDKTLFVTQFNSKDYEGADLNYYYETVKNWSNSKNEMRIDWIATARNFILRDKKDNKMVLKPGYKPVLRMGETI